MGETDTKVSQLVNSTEKQNEGESEHVLEQGKWDIEWKSNVLVPRQRKKEPCRNHRGHTELFKAPERHCYLETYKKRIREYTRLSSIKSEDQLFKTSGFHGVGNRVRACKPYGVIS